MIELGRITVNMMEKAPYNLLLDKREVRTYKSGTTPCPRERAFVDTTSLVEWKQTHMKDVDLGGLATLGRVGTVKETQAWCPHWYRFPHAYSVKDNRITTTTPHGTWITDDVRGRGIEV